MLRSCVSGVWRFYKNDREKLTRGRFYFVPENTPTLDFPHYFFSAGWADVREDFPNALGPVVGRELPWNGGDLFIQQPPGRPVGRLDQFTSGLTFPEDVNTAELRDGITERCWLDFGFPFLDWNTVSNLGSCCLRSVYFKILLMLYDDETDEVRIFFRRWLGEGVQIDFFPLEGLAPAMCIVTSVSYQMVFITGTTIFQQIATQATTAFIGPANNGGVRTIELWFNVSTLVMDRMLRAGFNALGRLLLVGHSYGAAVCAIAAVRAFERMTDHKPFVLTAGLPKPGDRDFMRRLERDCVFFPVTNVGDVVASLPLSPDVSLWFPTTINPVLNALWAQWQGPTEWLAQHPDGTKRVEIPDSLGFDVAGPIMVDVFAGRPIGTITAHQTQTYIDRSLRGCRCPEWPFTRELWNYLFGPAAVDLPLGIPRVGDMPRLDLGVPPAPARPRMPMGVPEPPARPRMPMGVPQPPTRPRLPMGVSGMPGVSGVSLGSSSGSLPAFTGLRLGVSQRPESSSLSLGAAGTPAGDGLEVGAAGTPAGDGLEVGAAGTPAGDGLEVGAAGTPEDAGLEVGNDV